MKEQQSQSSSEEEEKFEKKLLKPKLEVLSSEESAQSNIKIFFNEQNNLNISYENLKYESTADEEEDEVKVVSKVTPLLRIKKPSSN